MEEMTTLKVVLLEKGADLQTISLPAKKEGHYSFVKKVNGKKDTIVKIDGIGEKWVANCVRGGHFESQAGSGSTIEITENTLARVVAADNEYLLYVEMVYNNNKFVPYYLEPHNTITFGRKENECDVCYPNQMVSSPHMSLQWENDKWYITDMNSTNGVFVNDMRVRGAKELAIGDIVYILGLYIIVGVGFIAMNNGDGRATITNPKLRQIKDTTDVFFSKKYEVKEEENFDRVIRLCEDLSTEEIELEGPPMKMMGEKVPLALRMSNQLVMSGQSLMSGNLLSIASSLVMPSIMQGFSEKDRKEYESKRKEFYTEYLQKAAEKIAQEIDRESKILNRVYPSLGEVLQFPVNKNRLWERRKYDTDFLRLRIGSGDVPILAKVKAPMKRLVMDEDDLLTAMYKLAEADYRIKNGPVLLDLKDDFVVGVAGPESKCHEMIHHIIMQLVMTHSYDEAKLIMIAGEDDRSQYEYVKYLPHNWDDKKTIRFYCENATDAQQLNKYLIKQIEELEYQKKQYGKTDKGFKSYVIVATDKEVYESIECLKKIQEGDEYNNFSIIAAFEGMPKECKKVIACHENNGNQLITLYAAKNQVQPFSLDIFNQQLAFTGLQELCHTKLNMEGAKFALPNMITFMDLFEAGRVEHLNPLSRWKDNNPIKSLAVPIGLGTDGKYFMLDLHEKYHGPHGLIAGGTGSGKSEFIITYILSLAVNFSPDEVAFVLVDYKGGGLTDAFVSEKKGIHLPHVIGTITNLDGAAISRSLLSIDSELKRRQAVFQKAKGNSDESTMDIYDYQKLYRNGQVSEPMPHLFIISDEFAELKSQQPEFMEKLISIARIGRSLGVHLILATQRPAGVVNDQIWSNSKFRICLRVATRNDSEEMLKRPEAAEIRNTGRFYLQVGYNELFSMGQSAWCGADYIPKDEVVVEKDNSVNFIDNMGQTIIEAKPKKDTNLSEGKQIVSIVKYLSDLAKEMGIVPGQLWCEPLPAQMEYDDIKQEANNHPALEGYSDYSALVGKIDDPVHQEQFPFMIDMLTIRSMLIAGNSGSGKSNLIRTMLYSMAENHSPEEFNYYILDMSGGVLRPFSALPHCGAYLTEDNGADFDRLLDMLKDIIAKRKELFAQADVSTYEAYVKIAKLPLIFMVIDGYANIGSLNNGQSINASLYEYIREAGAYGIRYIVAINHLNELHSRARQEIDYKIALQAKDKYEYADILDAKVHIEIAATAGRGVCIHKGTPLEYHVAMPDAHEEEQVRSKLLKERLDAIIEKNQGVTRALTLPMTGEDEPYDVFVNGFKTDRIPLGYQLKDMKKVAMPLQQLTCMAMYFGNPLGIRPVFENMMYMAEQNNMEVIVLKKNSDSVFASYGDKKAIHVNNASIYDTSQETIEMLHERIIKEITDRNVFRDEFCQNNGIPATDKNRVQKAYKYIKERTKPLLVVFESLGDVCRIEDTEDKQILMGNYENVFFKRLKGYNIYFMAGFYPEDYELRNQSLVDSYCSNQFGLLFGGCYDKQIIMTARTELYSRAKVEMKYNRFIMNYRDSLYSLRMPCGELLTDNGDPDENPII
ncbi:MAG: type VII secretion protein EssC [Lachnospiraceae bacterium]|nr:type VII secretion protein EssC [Lachnospiraceae bacterium]